MAKTKKEIDDAEVLRIAADAVCDPRTVRRHISDGGVRGSVAKRIDAALEARRGIVRGDGGNTTRRES